MFPKKALPPPALRGLGPPHKTPFLCSCPDIGPSGGRFDGVPVLLPPPKVRAFEGRKAPAALDLLHKVVEGGRPQAATTAAASPYSLAGELSRAEAVTATPADGFDKDDGRGSTPRRDLAAKVAKLKVKTR